MATGGYHGWDDPRPQTLSGFHDCPSTKRHPYCCLTRSSRCKWDAWPTRQWPKCTLAAGVASDCQAVYKLLVLLSVGVFLVVVFAGFFVRCSSYGNMCLLFLFRWWLYFVSLYATTCKSSTHACQPFSAILSPTRTVIEHGETLSHMVWQPLASHYSPTNDCPNIMIDTDTYYHDEPFKWLTHDPPPLAMLRVALQVGPLGSQQSLGPVMKRGHRFFC